MSKLQWIGCFALAAAVAAPALVADEPAPFPQPQPSAPDTPPQPAPEPKSPDYPAPAPAPKSPEADRNPQAPDPTPRDATMPKDDTAAPKDDTTMPPTAQVDVKNVSSAAAVNWAGQSLKFEQSRFQGEARLYARSKDSNVWQVYRGADLDTILRANPSLATHPEVAELKANVAGPAIVRIVVQGANIGFEQELNGEARLFARSPRGETMWSGTDLAAIAQASPEVTQLPEWSAFEARVRAANPAAMPVRLRDGVGGVTVITYAPREVVLTMHSWRDRGWQARSYRGMDLQQVVRLNPELSRSLDLGDASMQTPAAPATSTPAAQRSPATSSQPAQHPTTQQPGAYPPATPPTPTTPPSPPAGGGGTSCGGGGKNCGK